MTRIRFHSDGSFICHVHGYVFFNESTRRRADFAKSTRRFDPVSFIILSYPYTFELSRRAWAWTCAGCPPRRRQNSYARAPAQYLSAALRDLEEPPFPTSKKKYNRRKNVSLSALYASDHVTTRGPCRFSRFPFKTKPKTAAHFESLADDEMGSLGTWCARPAYTILIYTIKL